VNILFIHQNFPGQFKHLAPALASRPRHQVVAMHINPTADLPGVRTVRYAPPPGQAAGGHRWLADLQAKVVRGEAAYRCALTLKEEGFVPDVIVAHPGWGESLFLQDVWPQARLGIYCEFYYHAQGADSGFDPEFGAPNPEDACRLRLKNANYQLHFPGATGGLAPTQWQKSVFPDSFRSRIRVQHDGIDTDKICPNPGVRMTLRTRTGDITLSRDDEVITFVNRNLEPYRGYHTFMRALPEILKNRPKALVLIVGADDVSYGARPDNGQKWKGIFAAEVRPQISDADWSRVYFLGNIAYQHFIPLLQLSTVHVYLTYPFVLSWSLLESMSAGCAIVASDTQPLHEAIKHNETGKLVNFFDHAQLASKVCDLLEEPQERQRLGAHARAFAQQNYDLQTVCLPKQLEWVQGLVK
jgi:glycosyltransferase involved in cell wall biosynthesis